MIINELFGISCSENPVLISLINSFLLCAALPLIGIVINFITDHIFGSFLNRLFRSSNAYYFFHNYITAPGVIIHELSHLLLALVTFCKVTKVELFRPRKNRLGGVEYMPRGSAIWNCVQMTLVSCAPVISGMFISSFLITWFMAGVIPGILIPFALYLLICVILHMNMSGQDIKVYIKGVWIFFILFFVYFLVLGKK